MTEPAAHFSDSEPSPAQRFKGGPWNRLAYLISLLFHPLVMPSLLFAVLLWWLPFAVPNLSPSGKIALWGVLSLATLVIPFLSLISLRMFGNLRSLHMEERSQRPLPMFFVSIYYLLTTGMFLSKYPEFVTINGMLIGTSLTLVFLTLITLVWKISAHSGATGGSVGFALALVVRYNQLMPETLYLLAGLMLLSGIVMWARLYLRAHSLAESLAGWMLGMLVSLASLLAVWLWQV